MNSFIHNQSTNLSCPLFHLPNHFCYPLFRSFTPFYLCIIFRDTIPSILQTINTTCNALDLKPHGLPSDYLLEYAILALSTIHTEESLVLILKKYAVYLNTPDHNRMKLLCSLAIAFDLSIRLQTTLQNLGTYGGPLYPTKPVRNQALDTFHSLYPVYIFLTLY